MKQQMIRALGSKVVIGVGATVLAFGTAGTVIALQPASDSTADHGTLSAAEETTTTTSTTSTTVAPTTTTTSTTVAPTTTTTTAHDANDDHPDNFGAMVSEDAHDGGVDGHEISQAAHDRNEARRATAGHDADDDHGGERGHSGSGRDHAEDED